MAEEHEPPTTQLHADAVDMGGTAENLPSAGDERPPLNVPDVVEGILRDALKGLLDARTAAAESGQGVAAKGVAYTQGKADELAEIFLGRGQKYFSTPWNAEGQIDHYVRQVARIDGIGRELMVAYFMQLFVSYLDICSEMDTGEIGEDDAKFRVDALVEDATKTLLGIPLDRE